MGRNIGIRNLLMLFLFFLIAICSLKPTFSQTTRPVCYTQISAANQACSILSPQMVSEEVSVVTNENHKKDHHDDDGGHEKHHKVRDDDDGDGHDGDHEGDDDDDDDDRGGDDDKDHGNDDDKGGDDDDKGGDDDDKDHGDDDKDHGDDGDGGHKKRRKRHKEDKYSHIESSANKECCKWLKELDNDCVCESLLRLPPFLVKPKHKYTIKVGRSCKLTFDCPGILHLPRIEGAKY